MLHSIAAPIADATLSARSCPLLCEAVQGLIALLRECDVDPQACLGTTDPAQLLRGHPNLRDWASAGLVPVAWLNAAFAELEDESTRLAPAQVVDLFLVPVLLRGLGRLPHAQNGAHEPAREAVASLLAVDTWRALVSPELAPDAVIEGPGCHTDPRVALGLPAARYLAGRMGFEGLVQAAAGQVPWLDAVDAADRAMVDRLLQAGPWPELQQAPRPKRMGEQDAAWIEDLLVSSCVRRRRVEGWPCAVPAIPPGGGLLLDAVAGELRPLGIGVLAGQGDWLDPVAGPAPLPPVACHALRKAGWDRLEVRLTHLDALEDLTDALLDLCDKPPEPQVLEGDGFRIALAV
ncbi:MAG: hypothetical protein ACOYOB_04665 [Myxococcota bacterium]